MAVNCPLLQHADNIIKKSLRSMFSDKKQSWTRVGIFFAYLRILRTLLCPNQLKFFRMLLLMSPLCATMMKYIYWELMMLFSLTKDLSASLTVNIGENIGVCATNIGTTINISAIGKAT